MIDYYDGFDEKRMIDRIESYLKYYDPLKHLKHSFEGTGFYGDTIKIEDGIIDSESETVFSPETQNTIFIKLDRTHPISFIKSRGVFKSKHQLDKIYRNAGDAIIRNRNKALMDVTGKTLKELGGLKRSPDLCFIESIPEIGVQHDCRSGEYGVRIGITVFYTFGIKFKEGKE